MSLPYVDIRTHAARSLIPSPCSRVLCAEGLWALVSSAPLVRSHKSEEYYGV
jgi:hypothetical protein